VDPVMMMYRGNSIVDEIVQRIIAHEEPVELWPSVKKDLEKSQDHCEHFLWAVHAPSVSRTHCACVLRRRSILTTDYQSSHRIWIACRLDLVCVLRILQDIFALQEAFYSIDSLYIADGHHRTAAACNPARFSNGGKYPPLANSAKYDTACPTLPYHTLYDDLMFLLADT